MTRPNLNRLYGDLARRKHYPVILIPGVFGSRLVNKKSGKEVWPGGFFNLMTGRHFNDLAIPVTSEDVHKNRDSMQPAGLFFEAVGHDFYGEIIKTLEGPGGYHCAPADRPRPETDCYLFSWDWRRDFTEAAAELDRLIESIRRRAGDTHLKVDIVAHSAGALVARYYLRFGGEDVLNRENAVVTQAGAAKVRKAVLITPPNFGSVTALQVAMMGYRISPFGTIQPETLATFPSTYQLLPHPDRDWMVDEYGQKISMDLYNIETWEKGSWWIFDPKIRRRIGEKFHHPEDANRYLLSLERLMTQSLVRARWFHHYLSIPVGKSPTHYIVFGGDCHQTPARCLMETVHGRVMIRLRPDEVVRQIEGVDYERLMLEPGDGRVTKASVLARTTLDPEQKQTGYFPIEAFVFLCRDHEEMPGDITFRDNLLNVLLY
ncbi:MAG: hypothetical protein HYT77_03785 [Deltaproteobacteria bacterium]|nr:hypothetical protein [Deltaproteobacteria bacterium]